MPSEPLPFHRKDLLKDRKPSSSDLVGATPARWREPPTTPSQNNNHISSSYCRRGGGGAHSDFRRPVSGKVVESGPREYKYCRNNSSKENNNNNSRKDPKGGNSASPNGNSHPHSDFIISSEQHAKNNGGGVSSTGVERLERENSLGSWKPVKWVRSGSLSSRGSGFSHSSSCKIVKMDTDDTNNPLPLPSGDAASCPVPKTPDEASSRKKPRLGWGEGLAKYEKKKVEPDDIIDKEAGTNVLDKEDQTRSDVVKSSEPLLRSPSNLPESASPTTSGSFASPPGVEEKESIKAAATVDNDDTRNPSKNQTDALPSTLCSSSSLQTDDTSASGSRFSRSSSMEKLQAQKADISRKLELTEAEIDSLENELESLISHVGGGSSTNKNAEHSSSLKEDMHTEKADTPTSEQTDSAANHKMLGSVCKLYDSILVTNKELAKTASDEFSKILPTTHLPTTNIPRATNDVSSIQEKIAKRKRFIKFKEKIITLKFLAYNYSHKEKLHIPNLGSKSLQKKFDLNYFLQRKYEFNPASRLFRLPPPELCDYVEELMRSDSHGVKKYRNELKMPCLILDKRDRTATRFISDNGLVENPIDVEKERSVMNPWSAEEKKIFLEKYNSFGKDFKKVSSFLKHKTVADCVEFYYKNHKSGGFKKRKKNLGKSSGNKYLVTKSGRRMTAGGVVRSSSSALDVLGDASAMVEGGRVQKRKQRRYMPYVLNEFSIYCNEAETAAAADVLAGICGSISSSEALGSCVTKREVSTADVDDDDEEICSDEESYGGGEMGFCDWSDEEKLSFVKAVRSYGKDFEVISRCMRTRSVDQCKVFFSKARKRLGLDSVHLESSPGVKQVGGGGGGSDHDHSGGSAISCDKSSSEVKMDVECDKNVASYYRKQKQKQGSEKLVGGGNMEEAAADSEATGTANDVAETLLSMNDRTSASGSGANVEVETVAKVCEDQLTSQARGLNLCPAQDDVSSRLSFRKSGDRLSQRSSSTDDGYHLRIPKHSLMDCAESSQVSRSFPVATVSTNKPTNLGYYHQQQPPRNKLKLDENLLLPRDCSLQMCTTGLQRTSSPTDVGKQPSNRSGDVKLFGQILTNASSHNNHQQQENDNKPNAALYLEKPNVKKSYNLKLDNQTDRNLLASLDLDRVNTNNNLPLKRSYGFWDGNKIQTSLPSLPDSSMLLAKYPAAFAKYEPQTSRSVVPTFTVDKLLSEMPTRTRHPESLPSTLLQQQHGRSMVVGNNKNIVGGVSDPVAALRMHYANTDQQRQQQPRNSTLEKQ